MGTLLDRLLSYVRIDTQANEASNSHPSMAGQKELAGLLALPVKVIIDKLKTQKLTPVTVMRGSAFILALFLRDSPDFNILCGGGWAGRCLHFPGSVPGF